jgi:hypothetical protein
MRDIIPGVILVISLAEVKKGGLVHDHELGSCNYQLTVSTGISKKKYPISKKGSEVYEMGDGGDRLGVYRGPIMVERRSTTAGAKGVQRREGLGHKRL